MSNAASALDKPVASGGFVAQSLNYSDVLAGLEEWRKDPNSEALNKKVQQACLEFLLGQDDDHWFCSRGYEAEAPEEKDERKNALSEIATFCVRLVGYKAIGLVQQWKSQLEKQLLQCPACAQGWVYAQQAVGDQYLRRRWAEDVVKNWYTSFRLKEMQRVKEALKLFQNQTEPVAGPLLPIMVNILSDKALYSYPPIISLLSQQAPHWMLHGDADPWPQDVTLPPGLLLLLFHENDALRAWAHREISAFKHISFPDWNAKYSQLPAVTFEILETVAKRDRISKASSRPDIIDLSEDGFPFTNSPVAFWKGMMTLLRMLEDKVYYTYLSGGGDKIDIVRLIAGHLGDKGEHWEQVIGAFRCILDKMDSRTWANVLDAKDLGQTARRNEDVEDLGYAGARLYDALDNDRFVKALEKLPALEKDRKAAVESQLFGWIYPFLRSLRSSHYFLACFSGIFTKLLDDFGQKAHFDNQARAASLKAAMEVLNEIFSTAGTGGPSKVAWKYLDKAIKALERHVHIIVRLAFDRQYTHDEVFLEANTAAQTFIRTSARRDATSIRDYVYTLTDEWREKQSTKDSNNILKQFTLPPLTIFDSLVSESYEQLQIHVNVQGISAFAQALSINSHLVRLSSRSWLPTEADRANKRLRTGMRSVNDALEKFNSPIARMLRLLANEDAPVIKQILRVEGMPEAITILIMSPNESIANAAQSLIRQCFDVSSRPDCFRSLLTFTPGPTLRGIIHSLRTFKDSAIRLPEACDHAKRLVRCLTDCIAVMCDSTDRIIRDEKWVETNNAQTLVSRIWNLMASDISIIFEQTEHWAVAFENEQMTEWMRDALIFLNEMLDEVRSFEAAATGTSLQSSDPTPRKMSKRGREMIEALNEPLAKALAWLRLNDKDLLDQTVQVVVRLIDRFAKSQIPLSDEVIKRLRKMADKYKDSQSRKGMTVKPEDMMALFGALSRHPDHAEEFSKIIIIGKKKGHSARIEVNSDDGYDSDIQLLGEGKGGKTKMGQEKSKPVSSSRTAVAHNGATRPLPSSAQVNKPTFKVAKPGLATSSSAKLRTAPTKMKNALYSHSAMRAARDRSSSEDESDSSRPSGLARLAAEGNKARLAIQPPAPLTTTHANAARKTKLLELQEPGQRSQRRGNKIMTAAEFQRQNQNKARMRYNPDYTDLHRRILQWDVTHTGTVPPGNFTYPRSIPSSFESANHYVDTFLPLLLLECWNEIITARDEINDGTAEGQPLSGRLAGRASVDDFVEVFVSIDRLPDRTTYTESDVILLSGPCQTLGKIHQLHRKQNKVDFTIRVHLGKDAGILSRSLQSGTQWTIHKLFSLSTAHREYAALMSLPYYDLLDEILIPPHHEQHQIADVLLDRAMAAYRVNKPQARAILSSLSREGFSLIQGPPGTGKTKTILGLVGAYISNRGRRASNQVANHQHGQNIPSDKLLLCAPSNAAVDEIAKRLKDGVFDSEGKKFIPKVVRIGTEFSINVSVSDVFLDNLVEKALSGANGQSIAGGAAANIAAARSEMFKLKSERDEKRAERNSTMNNTAMLAKLSTEISELTSRIDNLAEKLDSERDRMTQANRAQEAARRKVRAEILAEADVICSTLSGSGHEYLANFDFETVIIDEAAQSVEISSLIPLKYNCQRCIMVGDPNQLPPTVKSREGTQAGYNRSLFVRIHAAAPEATHLLSIQYRMHPEISSFPSKAFYESRLGDGPDMAKATKQPWHEHNEKYPPYVFLHVKNGREEQGKHHSLFNRGEATVATALYARLLQDLPNIDLSYRVGIITPYKGQLGELKKQFRRKFGDEILNKVDFNTVDGFQGQEKDIIILSCVRGGSGDGNGIGFLSDTRRMNVALTRARSSLFILGDSRALKTNMHWRKLVDDAEERGCLREVDQNTFAESVIASTKPLPAVSRKTPAEKGKARTSDASKRIMAAPEGLMTPAELAKQTSELKRSPPKIALSAQHHTGTKLGPGLKRKAMDPIKTEPVDDAIPEDLPDNIFVKRERVEDENMADANDEGIIGAEITSVPEQSTKREGPNNITISEATLPRPIAGGDVTQAVKRPPTSSMFIPRKKPTIPLRPPGGQR